MRIHGGVHFGASWISSLTSISSLSSLSMNVWGFSSHSNDFLSFTSTPGNRT
ncbi:hypothetical protein D3C83_246160 [compost metagenome]